MRLVVLGIPFAKQSFRFTRTGIKYQPKELEKKQDWTRQEIIDQLPEGFSPYAGPVVVKELLFVFPPLKGFSKAKLRDLEAGTIFYKDTKPDLTDNLQKGLWDAMQGIVFHNDSQICELNRVRKVFGIRPRIEVELEELGL